jgi:pimeloyl-ACP methyl ester carboxylesterase
MPTADCDGIETYYEVRGAGPPLLLFSPGGFNATIENWSSFGIYERLGLLDELSRHFTCIAFDKREAGRSGGRVEVATWTDYARQGAALLGELGVERAHLLGGCIGCSIVAAFAVAWPERTERIVLYSPAGGPKYRRTQHARFAEHAAFALEAGLDGVVELARGSDSSFSRDPRVGPWASVLRADDAFAAAYRALDLAHYRGIVEELGRSLFDRDTAPGPEPEELMAVDKPALVVPGHDPSHATSAARYLEECLPRSEYWDVPPEEQTAANAPARVVSFLQSSDPPRSSTAI